MKKTIFWIITLTILIESHLSAQQSTPPAHFDSAATSPAKPLKIATPPSIPQVPVQSLPTTNPNELNKAKSINPVNGMPVDSARQIGDTLK